MPVRFSPSSAASPRRWAFRIASLGLLLRLLHVHAMAATPAFAMHRIFAESDMHAFDQWARRIAAGDWLGRAAYHPLASWQLAIAPQGVWNDWYGASPVYYKSPFYAYLIAALYCFHTEPMLPLALLQTLASAAATYLIFRITQRLFGTEAGFFAAAAHALYGPDIHYTAVMLRGPWIVLVSLLCSWELLLLLDSPSRVRAACLGGLLGIALLVNEGFAPAPILVALVLIGRLWRSKALATVLVYGAAGLVLVTLPLVVRNVLVGAPPLQLAVTLGITYAVFNVAGSSPYFFEVQVPLVRAVMASGHSGVASILLDCLRSFQGPRAVVAFYLKKLAGLVIPFENPDNASFYYAVLKDPLLGLLPAYGLLLPFAALGGLLAARRTKGLVALIPFPACLLASMIFALPLSRYRATAAVFLMPLAGNALARGMEWVRAGKRRPLAAAALVVGVIGLAAGWLQARVVFAGRPASSFLYRPAEFRLGAAYYAGMGRFADAAKEVRELARLSPEPDVRVDALLIAADLHAAGGAPAEMRAALEEAAQIGAHDPGLLLSVGDAYARLANDRAAGRKVYLAARSLSPEASLAEIITTRLRDLEGSEAVK